MKLQEFINIIKEKVSSLLGPEHNVVSKKILKNNSIEFDCLVISQKHINISPSIYLNRYYLEWLNGKSLEEIAEDIVQFYKECGEQLVEKNCGYIDTENSKDRVILRLVNYKKNSRILKDCPYDRINDLAVTYHYLVSDNLDEGMATARIDYNNMSFFNLTEKDLREFGLKNTQRFFPPVFEKLENLLKKYFRNISRNDENIIFDDIMPMYVLTTAEKLNGAVCILYDGMLERIHKVLNRDYYIIPSSINEVLILPANPGIKKKDLDEMVKLVNKESVPETEVLSNRVYYYPCDDFKNFSIASERIF